MTFLYSKPFIISPLHWLYFPSLSSSPLLSSLLHSSCSGLHDVPGIYQAHTCHRAFACVVAQSSASIAHPLSFEICIQIPPTQITLSKIQLSSKYYIPPFFALFSTLHLLLTYYIFFTFFSCLLSISTTRIKAF